jgi:hypothetical protein
MLRGFFILYNAIYLSEFERRGILLILDAEDEL